MATRFKPPVELDVGKLLLDKKNPRIPLEKQNLSPDELTAYVADAFYALAIARSITAHQYFPSEPVIAIPTTKAGYFIVVEGNRRLAALKLLLNPNLRDRLADRKEWDALPVENVPKKIPVVVVSKRRDVAPIIGYRHISGIQPWDAHAKARYIADQVDGGLTFKDTAQEVGETETEVRMNYRNFHIAEEAEKLKIDPQALSGMKNGFGIFTRAMQSGSIRGFIGAPSPDKVEKKKAPIPTKKKDALKEMVEFLFGPTAVLDDSRDITNLGKAISSDEGLKALRSTRNLDEALVASGGILERLVNRLSGAARNLRAAKDDLRAYKKNKDVLKLIGECEEALSDLRDVK
jgi:hypothetical protein